MGIYLPKPNKTKSSSNGESAMLRYAVSAMQGWRTTMEDAHIAYPNLRPGIGLFGVFDGHGGAEVARFCAKFFSDQLTKNKNFQEEKFKLALEETFLKMDELMQTPEGQTQLGSLRVQTEDSSKNSAGCTAIVVLITKTEMYCANAGDSRAYVYEADGKATPMSFDHKPTLEGEQRRITQAGGYVSEGRVNDNLNLSRAIGDLEFKRNSSKKATEQIIIALPDVVVYKLEKKPRFVIMGCDGIWETTQAQQICDKLYPKIKNSPDGKLVPLVEELLDSLLGKDTVEGLGCDNMSAIVIVFK